MSGRAAVALLAASLLSGCDPEAFLLDVGLAPGLRETYVELCCDCLAREAPPSLARCRPDDGGAQSDACLCEASSASCQEQLLAGETVTLVGACTAAEGPCASACEDVLAYPSPPEE